MHDALRESLRAAVEYLHGCPALWERADVVTVVTIAGQTVEREVATFSLVGHASATTCFAWVEESAVAHRVHHHVVLRAGPVRSPRDALLGTLRVGSSPARLGVS